MNTLLKNILSASVYDVAKRTPLDSAKKLSKKLHASIFLKREDLQPVFSFKIRGAYNKMINLTDTERRAGVSAVSAGNHAQGVALSAQKLATSAVIVMPKTTPSIKVEAVQSYGAKVVLFGDNLAEAAEHCQKLTEESGRTFIHPYNDPLVIAGQGTIGKEILEQLPQVTHVFIPVGGGGLIAGISGYIKQIAPHIMVIGVEPEDAATLHTSLKENKRIILNHVGVFADGVAVRQLGENSYAIAKQYVDATITVSNDQICAAIKQIFEETRTIVEPAGALAVAGIQQFSHETAFSPSDNVVAINSGANMTFERLQYVTERTLIGSGQEALLSVQLSEEPGALEQFCAALGKHNISEFNYRQSNGDQAHILVGINTANHERAKDAVAQLQESGYDVQDLTDNELAKEHIRHMIGGKQGPASEALVHFNFPERPAALTDFLKKLSKKWNISLFHYRGMGSDNGRVLIGFDANQEDSAFQAFLDKTEFDYTIETDNSAYDTFLR